MRILILSIAVLFLFATGCAPSQKEIKRMDQAKTLLREAGVNTDTLKKRDEDLTLTYEITPTNNTSDKVLTDWGAIFGILQWIAMDDVHIVLTINGKPVAKVKADVDNIKKFSSGKMVTNDFLKKVSFSVVTDPIR